MIHLCVHIKKDTGSGGSELIPTSLCVSLCVQVVQPDSEEAGGDERTGQRADLCGHSR